MAYAFGLDGGLKTVNKTTTEIRQTTVAQEGSS
jgi:hypothetical protein